MGPTTNSNFSPAPNPKFELIKARQQFFITPATHKEKSNEIFDKLHAVSVEAREKIEDITTFANQEIVRAENECHAKKMAIFERAINGEPEIVMPMPTKVEVQSAIYEFTEGPYANNYLFHVPQDQKHLMTMSHISNDGNLLVR